MMKVKQNGTIILLKIVLVVLIPVNIIIDLLPARGLLIQVKEFCYQLAIEHLFSSKEAMWVAITGIVTAIAIYFSLAQYNVIKIKEKEELKKKLASGFYVEIKRNFEIALYNGLEVNFEDEIYKKLKNNFELVRDEKSFEILTNLYILNRYYNNNQENRSFLSELKTKVILEYFRYFMGNGNGTIFTKKETNRIAKFNKGVEEINLVRNEILQKFDMFRQRSKTSVKDLQKELLEYLRKSLEENTSKQYAESSLKEIQLLSLFKQEKGIDYDQRYREMMNKIASNGSWRSGTVGRITYTETRDSKDSIVKESDFYQFIYTLTDKIYTYYRQELNKLYVLKEDKISDALRTNIESTLGV